MNTVYAKTGFLHLRWNPFLEVYYCYTAAYKRLDTNKVASHPGRTPSTPLMLLLYGKAIVRMDHNERVVGPVSPMNSKKRILW